MLEVEGPQRQSTPLKYSTATQKIPKPNSTLLTIGLGKDWETFSSTYIACTPFHTATQEHIVYAVHEHRHAHSSHS